MANMWDNSNAILQNRSGEMLGQGIQGGANAFMQGMLQYQANKQMAALATAKFDGALQGSPDILKVLQSPNAPKEVTSAFKKLSSGGAVGLKDAAVLSTFAESFTQAQQQRQQMEQNRFLMQQQQLMAAEQQRQRQFGQTLDQYNSGVGQGVLKPQVQDNPFFKQAAQIRAATGQTPSAGDMMQYGGAPKQQNALDVVAIRQSGPNGEPIEVTYDKRTGGEIARGPLTQPQRPVLSPEEEAKKVEMVNRTSGAYKYNEDLVAAGKEAVKSLRDYDTALSLLDKTRTGTGATFLASAKRLGEALGVDVGEVKDFEQLQQLLGDAVLKRVNQTKGAVSDKEMALFDQYSASPAKTPEGNKAILTALKKQAARDRDIARKVQAMRKDGKTEVEIQTAVNDIILENPIFKDEDETALAAPAANPVDDLLKKYQ